MSRPAALNFVTLVTTDYGNGQAISLDVDVNGMRLRHVFGPLDDVGFRRRFETTRDISRVLRQLAYWIEDQESAPPAPVVGLPPPTPHPVAAGAVSLPEPSTCH